MRVFDKGQLALITAAAVLVTACGGSDNPNSGSAITAQQACVALAGKTTAGATVVAAAVVPSSGTVPTYCKVSAKIEPALNFEIRLPDGWNGKLHYGGGGGFNGSVPPLDGTNLAALGKGYVSVSSDSGHQAGVFDASWAIGNPQAEAMYGYLSVPTVMSSALEMVKLAYGSAPTKSYFEGCSNGGREGLISAQRYPNLFDGVIARAPALNYVGTMGAFNRNQKAVMAPGGSFTPAKIALLSNAVLAACDANDGISDGVVANPSTCSYNAQALRCTGGTDAGDTCLSDAQLAVVTSWTTPAVFVNGAYRNAGWALNGNESVPGNWDAWLIGPPSAQFLFQDSGVKSFVARDLTVDPLSYDLEINPAALERMSELFDATNPDLRPFKNSGGKLILWHGGSDPALSNKTTVEYYQNIVTATGGQANADAFTRLYIAPGVNHCTGGAGADSTDLLAALDGWVVKDAAPAQLSAAQLAADGSSNFTRPLCRYPKYPRYSGPANDANAAKLAANYTCTAP
jgi:feruloyl esterase